MTHPTDDEIAAVKFYTENPSAALADFDKRRSGRALLAEQAQESPEQMGYVPLSDDGKSVFIDGIGEVALAYVHMVPPVVAEPATPQPHKAEDAPSDAELLEWLIAKNMLKAWPVLYRHGNYTELKGYMTEVVRTIYTDDVRAAIRAAIAQERKA